MAVYQILFSVPHQMPGQEYDKLNGVASSTDLMKCLASDVKKDLQGKRIFTLKGLGGCLILRL